MSNEIIPHINNILGLVEQARQNALKSVNAELIQLYLKCRRIFERRMRKNCMGRFVY